VVTAPRHARRRSDHAAWRARVLDLKPGRGEVVPPELRIRRVEQFNLARLERDLRQRDCSRGAVLLRVRNSRGHGCSALADVADGDHGFERVIVDAAEPESRAVPLSALACRIGEVNRFGIATVGLLEMNHCHQRAFAAVVIERHCAG
jgi:hypothetical protein